MFRGDRYPGRRTLASARSWYMLVRPPACLFACLPACLLACLLACWLATTDSLASPRLHCLRAPDDATPTDACYTGEECTSPVRCVHATQCVSGILLPPLLWAPLLRSIPRRLALALRLIPIMISRKDAIQIELVPRSQCSVFWNRPNILGNICVTRPTLQRY